MSNVAELLHSNSENKKDSSTYLMMYEREILIIEKRFQDMRDKMLRRQQHELNIFLANQWHQLAVSDKEMSLNKLVADGWVA